MVPRPVHDAGETIDGGDSPRPAIAPISFSRHHWTRFVLLIALFHCTLFWEGCSSNENALLSLGSVGPVVVVEYDIEAPTSVSLVRIWPAGFACNVILIAVLTVLMAQSSQLWLRKVCSPRTLAATAIATTLFNSVLFLPGLWLYAVVMPVLWTAGIISSVPGQFPGLLGAVSRFYFALGVAVLWGLFWLVQAIGRKFFFVHPDRWQFSLAGLVATMVILGTGIGMLLRLFFG